MLPRRRLALASLLLAAACAPCAAAQSPALNPASLDPRRVDATQYGQRISLGPNWLFAPGDNPAWASPTFDDSVWQTISTGKELSTYGIHDIRYAWYRTHIHLRPDARNLAVALEHTFGSYEVYVNGVRVGSNGDMAGLMRFYQRGIAAYPVPDNLLSPHGDLVLALRFSVDVSSNGGRGTSMPLRTLTPSASSGVYLISRDEVPRDVSYANAHDTYDDLLLGGLALLGGLVALALSLAMRSQREYLTATVYLLASAAVYSVWLWADTQAYTAACYWLTGLFHGVANIAIIEFVRILLGRSRSRWLLTLQVVAFIASFGVLMAVTGIGGGFYLGFFTSYLPILLVDILLAVMLIQGWRSGNREARVLLPAVLVLGFGQYWTFLNTLAFYIHIFATPHALPAGFLGSYRFSIPDTEDFVFYLTMLLFLVLRTVAIARERALAAAELEAARTVQQILIPEEIPNVPGFAIQSAYIPAGEVGGDFFQIVPTKNGGVLAVIGDVSGKGMPAAMTVSLLVGTFRTLAHYTQSPSEILAAMNQRMLARTHGGFTTCLVLRADLGGQLTLANAGHLAPYLAGEELPVKSGLPLGLAEDTIYTESTFQLGPSQQLTLLTDGVVEARDKTGALFGFDRTAAISGQSTNQIAKAAEQFGQDDDITVLTLALATS
jgi:hypothetical protein